ncbi:MAG: hypothetical protein KGJ02_07055 [Verrucomicrobiota bacterium]|nr:hypothetical protein [Verrucomicrobiota bacterium]
MAFIQELGEKQEHYKKVRNSDYYYFISQLIEYNFTLGEFISPTRVGGGIGGFGSSSKIVDLTYGLTYDAIRKVLEIKKINAVVVFTLKQLGNLLKTLRENETRACVTDAGLLMKDELSYHAIALFIQRKERTIRVIALDCDGRNPTLSPTYFDEVKKRIPSHLAYELFSSKVFRQPSLPACYAFAINDCAALQKNPQLMEEILALNGFKENESGSMVIDQLPEPVSPSEEMSREVEELLGFKESKDNGLPLGRLPKSLLGESEALKKALEYQGLLVSYVRESSGGKQPSFCQRITEYFAR